MDSWSDVRLFSRDMRGWVDPADAFVMLYAKDESAFWLDRLSATTERYSVIGHAFENRSVSSLQMFQELAQRANWARVAEGDSPDFAFRPGFVGWFDYQQDPLSRLLDGTWLDVREALVFDHEKRKIFLIGFFAEAESFEEWVRAAMIRLPLAGGRQIGHRQHHATQAVPELISVAHDENEYLAMIGQAKAAIKAGEVYQICLTNQIRYRHRLDPLEVFLRLRKSNPAPYSNFIRCSTKTVISSSPEQFLEINSAGEVRSSPIKGTRARLENAADDAAAARELEHNVKERAENLMIVDLMRNDLGRVSQADTVSVTKLFTVESHATVHQLVSSVEAKLQAGVELQEVIAAVFPAGSMTGAPKIRAMQLISQMERTPRGTYSGAAGYFGSDGTADLGMVIRSLVFDGNEVSIGVGGGITIDSDPAAEFAEIRLKAKALLEVLGVRDPWASA